MIFDAIINLPPGTAIPKPAAREAFTIKGLGKRRGEQALIYRIPNHNDPGRPYEKGITKSEFELAHRELINSGQLSSRWFHEHMKQCAREGSCNFTTIGGIFELLSMATYKSGVYVRLSH